MLLAALLPAGGAALAAQQKPVVVTGAVIWDGTGAPAIHGARVVVAEGRIRCVGAPVACPAPADARLVDAAGGVLLPGLIDTHVHLLYRPGGVTHRSIYADLRDLLARGVTTVRDMGNNPPPLLEAADSARPAPKVFAMQLVAGMRFFRSEVERAPDGNISQHAPASGGMRQLGWWPILFPPRGNPDEVVKEALEAGAIGIKLYQDLDVQQVDRLSRAAHAAGLTVWGHAWVQPASALEQALAGQDGVVHAAGMTGELLSHEARDSLRTSSALLQLTADSATLDNARNPAVLAALDSFAARGTFLEPTLDAALIGAERAASHVGRIRASQTLPDRYAVAANVFGIEVTREAVRRGVKLTAGTDHVGFGPAAEKAQLDEELRLFVDSVGMTPAAALLAATRDAARALGRVGEDRGTIEPGRVADLVLLAADPLADIRNIRQVVWVMHDGTIYRPDELRALPLPGEVDR